MANGKHEKSADHGSAPSQNQNNSSPEGGSRQEPEAQLETSRKQDNGVDNLTKYGIGAAVLIMLYFVFSGGISLPGSVPGGDYFSRYWTSPGSGGTVRGATYSPPAPLPSTCTERMKYAYAKSRRLQTFNGEGCSALTEIIKGSGTLEDMAGNVDERWEKGRLVYQSPTPYNVTVVRFASSDAVLQFKLCRDHIPARANPSWQCR